MINHFLLKDSPVCNDEGEHPRTQANDTICNTNENAELPDAAGRTADLKPGRFEQSISVGSPDDLF